MWRRLPILFHPDDFGYKFVSRLGLVYNRASFSGSKSLFFFIEGIGDWGVGKYPFLGE